MLYCQWNADWTIVWVFLIIRYYLEEVLCLESVVSGVFCGENSFNLSVTSFSLFIRALEWIWGQSSLWFLLSVIGLLVVMGDFSADEDDTSDITTTVSEIPVLWYQIHQHIHYLVADCDDRTFLFTSFNLYQVGDAINYAYFTDGYGDRMRQLVRYFI